KSSSSRSRTAGIILAVLVLLIGTLSLFEYILEINIGIDEAIVSDFPSSESLLYPGRMSPIAAVSFILLGCALFFLRFLKRRLKIHPSTILLIPLSTLSLLAIVGYIYSVDSFYQFGPFISIAWQTALCFLILSLGIIYSRPYAGELSVLTSPGLGGVTARRL